MKNLLYLILFASSSVLFSQEVTTFILVRHAEKAADGTSNPSLNEAGKVRAIKLAEMMEMQNIAALYATPYKRTQQTLEPISDSKSLGVVDYDPYAGKEWLESLVATHPNQTVVISGHSNTIPILSNILIGEETFTQFDESDYSNLIIIVAAEVGKGSLVRLKF